MESKTYSGNNSVYNPSTDLAEFINNILNKVHNIHSVLQLFDSVFITSHWQKIKSPSSRFYLEWIRSGLGHVTPRGAGTSEGLTRAFCEGGEGGHVLLDRTGSWKKTWLVKKRRKFSVAVAVWDVTAVQDDRTACVYVCVRECECLMCQICGSISCSQRSRKPNLFMAAVSHLTMWSCQGL